MDQAVSLLSGLRKFDSLRQRNPDLADMQDKDLASMAYDQTGDPEMKAVADSSTLSRGIAHIAGGLDLAGKAAGYSGKDLVSALGGGDFAQKVGQNVGQMLPRTAMHLAIGGVGKVLSPLSSVANYLAPAASMVSEYGLTKAETGSEKSALGAAAAMPLSYVGSGLASNVLGKFAGAVVPEAQTAAKFLGSIGGTAVGDLAQVATADPSKGLVQNIKDFTNDPVQLTSYLMQQAIVGGGFEAAHLYGERLKQARDAHLRDIPDISEAMNLADKAKVDALSRKEVTLMSEQELQQMNELKAKQTAFNDFKAQQEVTRSAENATQQTNPESPVTLNMQWDMLAQGKRPIMMVPKDTNFSSQGDLFKKRIPMNSFNLNGDMYYYDPSKTNTDTIKKAVQTNTLGNLLGYGIPSEPANATQAVVLRTPQGTEKMAVHVDEASIPTVSDALRKLGTSDDTISIESLSDLQKSRTANKGMQKLFSLSGVQERDLPENSIVSLQQADKEAKIPGYVQVDFFEDQNGQLVNSRSANPRHLESEGYRIPTIPADLPTGQYTIAELKAALAQRGNTVTPVKMSPSGSLPYFSLFDRQANDYFYNSLLRKAGKAFTSTIKGFRTTGAALTTDANGYVGSKGLGKLIEKSIPPDIYEHLKQQGLDTLLTPNKVHKDVFAKWLREKMPQVEVKKLEVFDKDKSSSDYYVSMHQLEGLGYEHDFNQQGELEIRNRNNDIVPFADLPEAAKSVVTLLQTSSRQYNSGESSDAATGRYGVDPIDVSKMDRPVDILVRVPLTIVPEVKPAYTKDGKIIPGLPSQEKPLYLGPHFGDSDVNVVASVRGYMNGDTFVVFEVQSDWAQHRSSTIEEATKKLTEHIHEGKLEGYYLKEYGGEKVFDTKAEAVANYVEQRRNIKNHALLRSYETIAVKSAIKHALEQGATKIAFADGESGMMIERHDEYGKPGWYVQSKDGSKNGPYETAAKAQEAKDRFKVPGEIEYQKITQEPGMRQHYDQNIPNIARKLLGGRGEYADFGPMDRTPSAYFNGKQNLTGKSFDLRNVSPSVHELFSLYDSPKQMDFEKTVATVKEKIADGKTLSTEEFLDRATKGEFVDHDILAKFLTRAAGDVKNIRTYALDAINGMMIKGYSEGSEVAVNLKNASVKDSYATALHELSHPATERFSSEQSELYQSAHDYVNNRTGQERRTILGQIADSLKIDQDLVDLDYGAGLKFGEGAPDIAKRNTFEFVATVNELLAHASYDAARLPSLFSKLQWLPAPVYRMIVNAYRHANSYFSGSAPSARSWLSETEAKNMREAIDHVSKIVYNGETKDLVAFQKMQALGVFDPVAGAAKMGTPEYFAPFAQNLEALSSSDFKAFSMKSAEEAGMLKKIANLYEDNFLSSLFRSQLHPELQPLFDVNRHFRPRIKESMHKFFEYLGQDDTNSFSSEKAMQNATEKIERFTRPDVNRRSRLDRASRAFDENTRRAEEFRQTSNLPVPQDIMLTKEEIQNKFNLSKEDADTTYRLMQIPKMVMEDSLKMAESTDASYLTKFLFAQNKEQTLSDVRTRAQILTKLAGEVGVTRFQRQYYEKIIADIERSKGAEPEWATQTRADVEMLRQKEAVGKQELEMEARRLFKDNIKMVPEVGADPFLTQLGELAVRFGGIRAQNKFMSMDAGYAPMNRRGRYLVRVLRTDIEGFENGLLKASVGFNTKKEVEAYIAKNKLSEHEYEIFDKNVIKDRYSMYTTKSMKNVQERAKVELSDLASEIEAKYAKTPNGDLVKNILNEVIVNYKPIEDEVREILSVKGNKFAERRWNVPGFDVNDYIPNIMEYMNYQTIKAVRENTRAQTSMHMEHPIFDSDPALRARTEIENNYVLGNTQEWGKLRGFAFNWYLGASFRHFFQNITQVPMTGISQMVEQGAGLHAYAHYAKAMKMAGQYLLFGKTGDAIIDGMVKQAEKQGVTIPSTIEMFAPTTDKVQRSLDSFAKFEKGDSVLGERVKYEASKLTENFGRMMRSTAVSSEILNRRVAFIMSLLESKRTGITDNRQMYEKAQRFTDLSNFVGDKSNRPGFLVKNGFGPDGTPTWTHGALLTMTSMQSFVMNHIGQLYSFAKKSGLFNKQTMKLDFEGVNKHEAAAFATGTAHLLFVAGGLGLVGADLAEQVFEKVTGISLRTAIRKGIVKNSHELLGISEEAGGRLADASLYGLPGALGLDASQSLGLGSPLINYKADRSMSALDLAGPIGGLVQKGMDAVGIAASDPTNPDEWMRAARVASPQAFNYWLRMHDLLARGTYLDRKMQPITPDATGQDMLAAVTGFNPLSVTKERAVQLAIQKNKDLVTSDYQNASRIIGGLMYDYRQSGDEKSLQRAQMLTEDFMRKYPTQDASSLVDSITEQLQQNQTPYMRDPTSKEVPGFEQAMSVYPEVKPRFASHSASAADGLEVAGLLGQEQVLLQMMKRSQNQQTQSLLYDLLLKEGSLPPVARVLAKPRKTSANLGLLQSLSSVDQPPSE